MRLLRYFSILVFVFGSIWILTTSSSFQTCTQEQTAAEREQTKENPPPFVLSITNYAAICVRCSGHVIYEYRDAATAVATVLIALFTYTLYGATKGLAQAAQIQSADMKKSIVAAEIAANAAAQSAEAQIAIEGGRLICQPRKTTYWEDVGQWANRYPNSPDMTLNNRTFNVRFVLKNYGKTPATLREVNALLFKSANPPPGITITTPQLDLPNETVIASGLDTGEFIVTCRDNFSTMVEAVAVMNGEQQLWLHGRAVYDDVFGREGTHFFLYKLRHRAGDGSYVRYWDETTHRQKSEIKP
jgi:hypothetical protein